MIIIISRGNCGKLSAVYFFDFAFEWHLDSCERKPRVF